MKPSPFTFHPIATAPKDGTPILVRCGDSVPMIAWWNSQEDTPPEERSVYGPGWDRGHSWLSGVVEWMPIPDSEAVKAYAALRQHVKNLVAHFDSLIQAEGGEFPAGSFDSAKDCVEDARLTLDT